VQPKRPEKSGMRSRYSVRARGAPERCRDGDYLHPFPQLSALELFGYTTNMATEITLYMDGFSAKASILGSAVAWVMDFTSGTPPTTPSSGDGPRIIAYVDEVEYVVGRYGSRRAAKEELGRLQEELRTLGPERWAQAHSLPITD
jgi:hypothetical protein